MTAVPLRAERTSLTERVRALVEHAHTEYAGHSEAVATVDGLAARLDEPLRVAIAGRVKSGKSTLVNALVGEPLAATEVGECTRQVTWYRHGRSYGAFIERSGSGTLERVTLRRSPDCVDVDVDEEPGHLLERIVIEWPATVLDAMTLIDTPGLGSLSAETGARTSDFLVPDAEASAADAVVYLARHLHGADVRFLEAFRDDDAGRPTPINAIAVVARADEIGGARLDAMDAAARVAARYRHDPQLRRLCQTAVPVAGLLAFGSSQVTEDDFRALGRLAEASSEVTDELLLSTDRFTVDVADFEPSAAERTRLLARLGLYGVRLALELVSIGRAPSSAALALELRRRSGIDELRALLTTQFAARSHLLKARVALSTLDRLCRHVPLDDDGAFAAELERVEADTHELAELRLLVSVRTGGVALHDDEVDEVERLVERAGAAPAARIGLGDGATDDDVRAEIAARVERWRRRAEHPLAERATVDAATVVLRSYEGIRFDLDG